MRSVVLVAACLACAGHAHRAQATTLQQQVKHTEEQITKIGDVPHVKKLATLLLASSSPYLQAKRNGRKSGKALYNKYGGASAQMQKKQASPSFDNSWALNDENGHKLSRPVARGTHSQAEAEFLQKQQRMAKGQASQKYGHTWALGDEHGHNLARPIAGTHSQAEVEFAQKQDKWGRR
mmetsp:Transcript_87995/g.161079  ORF Transcript_87995/g.161079 Transcript_87995/m.161079 type:complete len:179 (+) Transcript_87995:85-621(+)